MNTTAVVYDEANPRGQFGVDIITAYADDELKDGWGASEDWDWNPTGLVPLTLDEADRLLAERGWRRTSDWEQEDAFADAGSGWWAPVEHIEQP